MIFNPWGVFIQWLVEGTTWHKDYYRNDPFTKSGYKPRPKNYQRNCDRIYLLIFALLLAILIIVEQ
jgi:hypothetical protein